jgi:hypothetical protein
MKLKKTITVLPILVSTINKSDLERIGREFSSFAKEEAIRELFIQEYRIIGDKTLILISGNVGNALEYILAIISGLKKQDYEFYYKFMERVNAVSRTIEDSEAEELMTLNFQECTELNSNMTSVYDY